MSPERWQKVKQIALQAMDLEPAQRAVFLDAEAGDDQDLRRRVEKLMAADAKSRDTFAKAIGEAALELNGPRADRISHYEIIEKIGEGGMGVVYKAQDTKLDRSVALKFLAPHLLRDPDARKRFEREARASAALDHPNICTVHEIDQADGHTFIALAFLDGETLSAKIAEGPLEIADARSIAIQLAEGLAAAHDQGVVHRDIKPDNVMLVRGPKRLAKIMDFGLAQLAGSTKLTGDGSTMGTIAYMSPEQAQGDDVDQRSDIWSLGAILYEMLAGKPPFRGEYDQAVIYSILNEDPLPLSELREDVPIDLVRIVGKALTKQLENRYQHVAEMLLDLQGRFPATTARHATAAPEPPSPPKSRLAWYALAAVALCVASVAWYFRAPPVKDVAAPLVAVPFTTYEGAEFSGTFSPSASQVAFVMGRMFDERRQLYIKSVGAEEPRKVTDHRGKVYGPAWSPTGRRIAYMLLTEEGRYELRVVPPQGGGDQLVTELGAPVDAYLYANGWGTPLSWSPDGQFVAAPSTTEDGQPQAIYLVDVDSKEKRQLTFPEGGISGDADPSFSRSGDRLAFGRQSNGLFSSQLHILALDEAMMPVGDPKHLPIRGEEPFPFFLALAGLTTTPKLSCS